MTDEQLKRFWLGELPPAEARTVQARMATDPAFREEVEIAESRWVDSWASGELRGADKEAFERLYLTTDARKSSARVAKALVRDARREIWKSRGRHVVTALLCLGLGVQAGLRRPADAVNTRVIALEAVARGKAESISLNGSESVLFDFHLDRPPGRVRVEVRRIDAVEDFLTVVVDRAKDRQPVRVAIASAALGPGEYRAIVRGDGWTEEFAFIHEPAVSGTRSK